MVVLIVFLLFAATNITMAETYTIGDVQEMINNKQYENALQILNEFVVKYPESPEILYLMGITNYFTNNFEEARSYLEKAKQNSPGEQAWEIDIYKSLFEIIFNKYEEHDKGIEILKEAENIYPNHEEICALLTNAYYKIEDNEKMLDYADKTLSINKQNYIANKELAAYYAYEDPDLSLKYIDVLKSSGQYDVSIKYQEAHVFEAQKNYGKAIRTCLEVIEEDPDFLGAYGYVSYLYQINDNIEESQKYKELLNNKMFGVLDKNSETYIPEKRKFIKILKVADLINNQRYNEAIIELENLIDKYPNDVQVVCLLGNAYFLTGRVEESKTLLEKGTSMQPIDADYVADSYIYLSDIYKSVNQLDKACDILLMGKKYFPENPDFYSFLGANYLLFNKVDKALSLLNKALELNKYNYTANYNMAGYYLQYDLNKSMKYVNVLKESGQYNIDVKLLEGTIYLQEGKNNKAKEVYKEIIKNDSNNYVVYYNLGQVYYKEKDFNNSIIYFKKTIQYNSEFIPGYGMLALSYEQLGELEKALEKYKEALEIDPEEPNLLCSLGILYHQLGERTLSLKYLNQYLKINPNDLDIKELIKNMGEK